ncbi:hypothetical protein TWF569_011227 [Orbilia oligospora]|nr:hypothetical protein TWF706_008365 [Orbilia oligospora]KAF3131364.1 hypothetical protein TWF569_011227 [Orbilia oligospora]KAF3148936.1 hypothetical protein TWF594_000390 [Orbilia oligospora]
MIIFPFHPLKIIAGLLGSWIAFVICRWIYRLSPLHPLAKFPTPSRWGCISEWYHFYWNAIHDGQLVVRCEEWHRKFGPIIRIGPNELHINVPSFYNTIFCTTYKFPVHTPNYDWQGPVDMNMANPNVAAHRVRRGLVSPFLSKASIQKLDKNIMKHVNNFVETISPTPKTLGKDCERLKTEVVIKPGDGVNVTKLLRRLTGDVISEYGYSESFGLLSSDKNIWFIQPIADSLEIFHYLQFAWPVTYAMSAIPNFLLKTVVPREFRGFAELEWTLEEQIDGFLRNPDTAKAKTTHKTIFETLVEGDSEIKLSKRALVGDSMVLIGAGTETTATTLAEAMYRACIYPELQARLHEELVKAFPNKTDEVTLAKAEKVQYIVAFLKETLRIAAPIPGRIARQTPIEGAMCKETFLPGRTVVSMSIHLMHMNAEIYPNPHKFDPERWMNSDPASLQEKYFVPFSKGSRGCIGTNLAWAEMITVMAATFRRYKLSLHPDNKRTEEWVDRVARFAIGDFLATAEEYE